jgi:Flp pilus assembly protein TadD
VLARIEVAEGNTSSALAAYERAAQSGDRISMRGLPKLLASLGDHDTAIGWYERIRAGAPRDGVNLNNLAISFRALGREAEAVDRFKEAIELQPR